MEQFHIAGWMFSRLLSKKVIHILLQVNHPLDESVKCLIKHLPSSLGHTWTNYLVPNVFSDPFPVWVASLSEKVQTTGKKLILHFQSIIFWSMPAGHWLFHMPSIIRPLLVIPNCGCCNPVIMTLVRKVFVIENKGHHISTDPASMVMVILSSWFINFITQLKFDVMSGYLM